MKKLTPMAIIFSLLIIVSNSLAISVNDKVRVRIANQLYKSAIYFTKQKDYQEAIDYFGRSFKINNKEKRFREGLLLTQKKIFKNSFAVHAKGDFKVAVKGYRTIINSPEIDKNLTNCTQRNVLRSKNLQTPFGLKEYEKSGKILLKENKPFEALQLFTEGYLVFPSKELLSGIQKSQQEGLGWCINQHALGRLGEAKKGYDKLLNSGGLKFRDPSLVSLVQRLKKYAEAKYTAEDLLNKALLMEEKNPVRALRLYHDGLLLYPNFDQGVFRKGYLELVKVFFDKAKLKHKKGNFKEAIVVYREILNSNLGLDVVTDSIFPQVKDRLKLAENGLPFDIKIAYLTFDDGPSLNTEKILTILKNYKVKATFFVTGNNSNYAKNLYRRIVEEGHVLGNHTYSHNYASIYSSLEAFKADFYKLEKLLEQAVGVKPKVMRYPGGSNNTVSYRYGGTKLMGSILTEMEKSGYKHFDWNVDSRDASKIVQDSGVIISSVLSNASKDTIIVLMHDNLLKTTTVKALPTIIEGLIKKGYVFKTLTAEVVWKENFVN